MKRVGIVGLLQESNTFIRARTTAAHFAEDLLARGEEVRARMTGAAHEMAGFFEGLEMEGVEAVPIFAARAYPHGIIETEGFRFLVEAMLEELRKVGRLDGILAAPHGATVAEEHPDADGHWLSMIRDVLGPEAPLIATLDPHANLSRRMVEATDALIAYATNPHLDQRETGRKAAELMARTLRGEVRPVQAAINPPLAINIQSQQTGRPPLASLYEAAEGICRRSGVLSHSLILGFPYADVAEMGSSAVVVTDGNLALAEELVEEVGKEMWLRRAQFEPAFTGVPEALGVVSAASERVLLLDMGDNVGGGAPGDGPLLAKELHERKLGPAFVCLHDPESVRMAEIAGKGRRCRLRLGGKTDGWQGDALEVECEVLGIYPGRFEEKATRHGGFQVFDQGRTAVVRTGGGLTAMLTSRRVPPFSLEPLRGCGLDPLSFRALVAKGVIAPLAAYGEVCGRVVFVNTPGVTCADMKALPFLHRRRPMFPFEHDAEWKEPGAVSSGRGSP